MIMKKSLKAIVAVVLMLSATLSVNAQGSNRVTERFHFGIRGGFSINSWRGDGADYTDALAAPTGGFAFDFQIAPVPVFLGFGVNYLNEGAIIKIKYPYIGKTRTEKETVNASAIHLPLVFGYHFNVAPDLFVSPYAGSFMSYIVEDMDDDDDDDDNFLEDERFNYGMRIGCGLNYKRLTFDMAYDYGLKNMGPKHFDLRSGTFLVTIGYNIAGER